MFHHRDSNTWPWHQRWLDDRMSLNRGDAFQTEFSSKQNYWIEDQSWIGTTDCLWFSIQRNFSLSLPGVSVWGIWIDEIPMIWISPWVHRPGAIVSLVNGWIGQSWVIWLKNLLAIPSAVNFSFMISRITPPGHSQLVNWDVLHGTGGWEVCTTARAQRRGVYDGRLRAWLSSQPLKPPPRDYAYWSVQNMTGMWYSPHPVCKAEVIRL